MIEQAQYALDVQGHRVSVLIDGCPFATLNMITAVNGLDASFQPTADVEAMEPELVSTRQDGFTTTLIWKSKSNLWEEKTYTLVSDPLRFSYKVTVKGHGKVDSVAYFYGSGEKSEYEFQDGFTPCLSYYNQEDYHFRAMVGCHRWSVLMVPPMFAYAFRCEGIARQLGLGLVAEKGEHNFHAFDYRVDNGFWLETDQHGHTAVDGSWTAPAIIGYAAENEYRAMEQYAQYYFSSGIAESYQQKEIPRFWHGPIACGWIEQFARKDYPDAPAYRCCESLYREYLDRMHAAGLDPKILIIDDKWQTQYATDIADEHRWPNLRAFVDEQHEKGMATMLWFKVFDPEGLTDGFIQADMSGGAVDPPAKKIDPSHPAFLKVLDAALERIFGQGPDCYDCDGIKIDYAFMNPIGRKFKTYSGKYGVELLYDYMEHIYRKVKSIKPGAIINCSACHPYFAHMVDQARLHDYDPNNRFCREDLMFRAKMYRIACPDSLIDTDNGGYSTHRDTMRCMLEQASYGIPDIYGISPFQKVTYSDADLAALAQVWQEYSRNIDAKY